MCLVQCSDWEPHFLQLSQPFSYVPQAKTMMLASLQGADAYGRVQRAVENGLRSLRSTCSSENIQRGPNPQTLGGLMSQLVGYLFNLPDIVFGPAGSLKTECQVDGETWSKWISFHFDVLSTVGCGTTLGG